MNDRIEYRYKLDEIQEEVFKRTSMLARGENAAQYNQLVLSRGEDFMFNPYLESVASEIFDYIVPFCRKKYNMWDDLEEQENPTEPDHFFNFGMYLDREGDYAGAEKRNAVVKIAPTKTEYTPGFFVRREDNYLGTEIYANVNIECDELLPTDILIANVLCEYEVVDFDGKASMPYIIDRSFKVTNMRSGVQNPITFLTDKAPDFIRQRQYMVNDYTEKTLNGVLDKDKILEDDAVLSAWFDLYGDDFTVRYTNPVWDVEGHPGEYLDMNKLKAYKGNPTEGDKVRFYRYKNYTTEYKSIRIKNIFLSSYVIVNEEIDKLPGNSYAFIGDELWYKTDEFTYGKTNRYKDTLLYCTTILDWFDMNAVNMVHKAIYECLVNGIISKWTSILGDNDTSMKYMSLYNANIVNLRNRINTQKKPVRRKYRLF